VGTQSAADFRATKYVTAAAVLFVAALLFASPALALNTAVWTSPVPVAGATVAAKPTAPSVIADDGASIINATMTMNGYPASFVNRDFFVGHSVFDEDSESDVWVVDDWTKARVTGYFPASRIIAGMNTIVTTVRSSLGVSTYTRTFTWGTATTITAVVPAADTALAASPSALSVTWTSANAPVSSLLKLDGAIVAATYTSGNKTFTHMPSSALSPGIHTAVFTARDVAGTNVTRTWTFTVRPPMSNGSECGICHTTYPAAHPVSVCASCHDHAYAQAGSHGGETPTASGCVGDGSGGQDDACHDLAHTSDPMWGVWGSGPFSCADCHSAAFPDVARHTDSGTATLHVSATDCSPCHSPSLVTEHAKYPTAAAIKYQCDLCHGTSVTQKVRAAVSAGSNNCSACHSGGTGHEALHTVERNDACVTCHAGTSLTTLHATPGCDGCHESNDPEVVAAIATGAKACSACHTASGAAGHEVLHNAPVTAQCAGPGCHVGDNLSRLHINAGTTLSCSSCHESNDPVVVGAIDGNIKTCSACHVGPAVHPNESEAHDVAMGSDAIPVYDRHGYHAAYLVECSGCHVENLSQLHSSNCAACHQSTNPVVTTAVRAHATACSACHSSMHGAQAAGHRTFWCETCHDVDGDNSVDCGGCHAPGAADTAAPSGSISINANAAWTQTAQVSLALTAIDEGGSGVSQMRFSTDGATWGAWEAYAISRSWTVAGGDGSKTVHVQYRDGAGNVGTSANDTIGLDGTAPSTSCNAVGGQSYVGDRVFELTPSDTGGAGLAGTWWQLDRTDGSWTSGTSVAVPAPPTGAVSHTVYWYSRDNVTNQESLKQSTFTVSAPSETLPPETTSSFNPGVGAIFNAAQAVTLSAVDSGGSGVNATYYRIDGGSYTAGTSFTVAGDGLHTFSYYSLDNANNTESVHTSNEFRIDTVAPTTSSSVVADADYVGAKTFTLTPTDTGGSGVVGTWWQLDSTTGSWTSGTSVSVAAPVSGSVSHTLHWYSRDAAANTELTRSVSFRVAAPVVSHGSQTLSFIGVPNPYPWLTSYPQSFTVPDGVTEVSVSLYGGQGGGGCDYYQEQSEDYTSGGLGGFVSFTLPVTAGESLAIRVGGAGQNAWDWDPVQGGWPNGGNAHAGSYSYESGYSRNYGGGGGGGSSSILRSSTILAEAGGGGGGALPGGPDGLPGGLPGNVLVSPFGNQPGGSVGAVGYYDHGAGGGGWNPGISGPVATGGTSYVAAGTGVQLVPGSNIGNGRVVIVW